MLNLTKPSEWGFTQFNQPDRSIVMSASQALLKARYGEATPWQPPSNAVIETLLAHRSVRAYLPDALPEGTLELLVAAAQSAASSSNLQVWSVVSVEDAERKARIAALANNQQHIHQAPLFLVWLADLARLRKLLQDKDVPDEELQYLELSLIAAVDAALAAQNAVVAAESLGLGTVYIGALRNKIEEVAAELKLPQGVFPLFGLVVGYPDPAKPAAIKPRLPQEAVLHKEAYDLESQGPAIDRYNQVIGQFYQEQQMNIEGDWSDHSTQRVLRRRTGAGTKRLSESLRNLGFPLL
jgi:nitroreductase